jgi:hypothetical protein
MEKKWVYAIMACVVIGTIFVIGSVAVNMPGTGNDPTNLVAVDKMTADAADTARSAHGSGLFTNITIGRYKNWVACTYSSDTTDLLIYKVPAGSVFQLDDVVMTTGIDSGYSTAYMWRGVNGLSVLMVVELTPHESFGQQFKGMILKSREQLKIRSYTSGSTAGVCWVITGHTNN